MTGEDTWLLSIASFMGLFHHVRYAYLWLHLSNAKIIHLMNDNQKKCRREGWKEGREEEGGVRDTLTPCFHQLLNTPVHGEGRERGRRVAPHSLGIRVHVLALPFVVVVDWCMMRSEWWGGRGGERVREDLTRARVLRFIEPLPPSPVTPHYDAHPLKTHKR